MRKRVEKLTGDMSNATAELQALNRTQEQLIAVLEEREGPNVTVERRAELDVRFEELLEQSRSERAAHDAAADKVFSNFPKWMRVR